MKPTNDPIPWDLDALAYLESRQRLLAKVARDHVRWEHNLAAAGAGLFVRETWTDHRGQRQTIVITAGFVATHGKLLASLIQDLAMLGPSPRALAARLVAEQSRAFTQYLSDARSADGPPAVGQDGT